MRQTLEARSRPSRYEETTDETGLQRCDSRGDALLVCELEVVSGGVFDHDRFNF
jgi:hypothetical protein